MTKRLIVFAIALLATASLAVGAASAKPEQQSVTLRLATVTQNKPGYDLLIANFERVYPNINIEPEYVVNAVYQPLLLTQIQAGNEPDLFTLSAGGSSTAALYALGSQGKLLDLTPQNPWWKRMPKSIRKYVTVKQRIYAFPEGLNLSGMLYNKDLFQQLGLKEPQTFGELLAMCPKIQAAGKIPVSLGYAGLAAQINLGVSMMSAFVYNKDPDWTLKKIQRKTTFAGSPLWQRWIQALVQMKDANCFQPAPAGTTSPQQYALLANGNAVMMPASTQELAVVTGINPKFNGAMFDFPADKASDTVVSVNAGQLPIAVSAKTQHPKEATTFINFIARPKQNSLYAKVQSVVALDDFRKGLLPALASPRTTALAKAGKSLFAPVSGWPRPDLGLWQPTFIAQFPGIFTGQRTPQQILEYADTLWAPVGSK